MSEPRRPSTEGHRHEGHEFQVLEYPCGCLSISCSTCDITDGFISVDCDPGELGYVHPALVARMAV